MRWIACELHTHTLHSDGRQTLRELAAGAAGLGFACIALTDHNTMSGLRERAEIERETGIAIIPGMEWTTFYGHMVTIGMSDYADWRAYGPEGLEEGLARIHDQGGLAGMAHPFRVGSPICTGCFWEYEIRDWTKVDYIEVWSGTFPQIKTANARAFELWTDRLNAGLRISAVSGRDWHEQTVTEEPVSVTYLGIDAAAPGTIADKAVKALAQGRASVTTGPLLEWTVEAGGEVRTTGDTLQIGRGQGLRVTARVKIDFDVRPGLWELPEAPLAVKLVGGAGELAVTQADACSGEYELIFNAAGLRWARAELWGIVRGAHVRIAFTNAIYFAGERAANLSKG
ncbi:CehA/McbA family metallohydrolase [Paenibacillus sp. LHD-117]|uniref:CehA/McbA family metallohydrolase n=1 Tax=Paenibacillus sp. LHD-117 TaxID=3071412 RepID=UPI0027DEE46C|nr:CehA/McbA family metallohydrolase [Paenibacillus sp. LHD-117]MDQ6419406.1 CehA/McbA family metallohydrolase [Paenibacillus sp. LHD-117]